MARVRERRRKRTERQSVELEFTAAMMRDELCTTLEEQSVQYWQAYAELSMMMRRSFQWANSTIYMHAHVARPATRPVKRPFQPQKWTSNIAYSKGRLKTSCLIILHILISFWRTFALMLTFSATADITVHPTAHPLQSPMFVFFTICNMKYCQPELP